MLLSLTRKIFLITLIAGSASPANATTQEAALWGQITASNPFSQKTKFLYLVDGQVRLDAKGKTLDTTVIRLGLGYQLTKRARLLAGYTLFPTTDEHSNWIIGEQRCWQQFNFTLRPASRWYSSSSTRLEQRFNKFDSETAWRLREKVKVFWRNPNEGQVTPVLSDEIFFNLNQTDWTSNTIVGQNRFFIGLSIPIKNKNKIQASGNSDKGLNSKLNIGYMNIYQRSSLANTMKHALFISLSI